MVSRSLSEADLAQLNISPNDRQDVVEEVLTEISVYFGMLYHLIEIFKGHEDFADELSECSTPQGMVVRLSCFSVSLDPPLPVYLFNVVSGLRDKSAKGYPIKKVIAVIYILTAFSIPSASPSSLENSSVLLWWHSRSCSRQSTS